MSRKYIGAGSAKKAFFAAGEYFIIAMSFHQYCCFPLKERAEV